MMSRFENDLFAIRVLATFLWAAGCSSGGGGDGDAGIDAEIDVETDTGSDPAMEPEEDSEAADDASFVSQDVPSRVGSGSSFEVLVTMRNTGATTWTPGPVEEYKLGSENPMDNTTWGTSRLYMQPDTETAPGESCTFTAVLTAPSTPGIYDMQWRMVHEHVAWFGQPTENVSVEVYACTPSCEGACCGPDGCGGTCPDDCAASGMICNTETCLCEGSVQQEISPASTCSRNPDIAVAGSDRMAVVWEQSNPQGVYYTCFDGSGWTDPAEVTPSGQTQERPRIAVDVHGNFHLVYSQGLGGSRQIHYTRFDGDCLTGSWADPEVPSADDSTNHSSTFPSVGVSPSDTVFVTWSQSGVPNISQTCDTDVDCPPNYSCRASSCKPAHYRQHMRRKLASGWDDILELSVDDTGTAHYGRFAVLEDGNAHLVWLHSADSGTRWIYYSHWDGSGWSDPEHTGIGLHRANVAADAEWVHVFNYGARYARLECATGVWTDRSVDSGTFSCVGLDLDAFGVLHASWINDCATRYTISEDGGDTWRESKKVSQEGDRGIHISLDTDEHGFAHVVWGDSRGTSCPIEADDECGAIAYRWVSYDHL